MYLNDDNTLYTGGAIFNGIAPAGAGSTAGLYRYNGPLRQGDFQFRKIDAARRARGVHPGPQGQRSARALLGVRHGRVRARRTTSRRTCRSSSVESERLPAVAGRRPRPADGARRFRTAPASTRRRSRRTASPRSRPIVPGGAVRPELPRDRRLHEVAGVPGQPRARALLDSRPNPNDVVELELHARLPVLRPRRAALASTARAARISCRSGCEGDLDGIDGSWDFVVSHGTRTLGLLLQGYAALERVRAVIQSPNFGHGFFRAGQPGSSGQRLRRRRRDLHVGRAGVPAARRTSRQDCLDAMIVELQHQSEMEQNFVEANVQGRLVEHARGRGALLGRRALSREQLSLQLRHAEHAVRRSSIWASARSRRTARAARRRWTRSTASCCCRC